MMSEPVSELKVLASLVDGKREVASVEKIFGLMPEKEEPPKQEEKVKSLDTIVGEFLKDVETSASERGYIPEKLSMAETSVRIILFLVRHTEPELRLSIPLEKPKPKQEDEKTGDKTNPQHT